VGTISKKQTKTSLADGERPKLPVREKGKRTREKLLGAAERVFERRGFLDARVADIAKEAKVSHGTFYTYFDSKSDIFREVAERVVDDIYIALDAVASEEKAADLIRAANQVFIDAYRQHASMLALIEQVATFDEVFREMRLELRRRLVRRVERALDVMLSHEEASIEPMDRHVLANALAGMVDNFAYAWFILEEPLDPKIALQTLDEIWVRALGLDHAGKNLAVQAAP
jgi:AcrR family transcriptional regulator